MKRSESGFTFIEFLVVMAIVALIAGAAGATTLQLFASTERSNDHMTAVRQVQNAGYWISRDALMAESTDNVTTPPEFLILNWTEWGYDEESIYHKVTYSFPFEYLSPDGIGKLKRTHEINGEVSAQTLVAEYIYYNPDDPDNTTKASYESSVLTVQIAAAIGEANEIKEYRVWHRPNF